MACASPEQATTSATAHADASTRARPHTCTPPRRRRKLSILGFDGEEVVTPDAGYGVLKVAVWSPDMYSAPPAWTRDEDGWDIRNRKHARIIVWKEDEKEDEEGGAGDGPEAHAQ